MSVHENHRQRMKAKFQKNGFDSFEQHEKLEFILFFAKPQGDTNALAHELLNKYKTIKSVLDASYDELLQVKGVGEHTAVFLKTLPLISSMYLDGQNDQVTVLEQTDDICQYFIPKFIGKRNEEVHIVTVDDANKILRHKKIFEGSVNATLITVKLIMEEIFHTNATGIILAHNHPQGIALPSNADIVSTNKIKHALELINIRLVDHVIITDDDALSFRESGFLTK